MGSQRLVGKGGRPRSQWLWVHLPLTWHRKGFPVGWAHKEGLGGAPQVQAACAPRYHQSYIKKERSLPWPYGSIGWSILLYTKRLLVRSLVGQQRGDNPPMFLSLPRPSLSI